MLNAIPAADAVAGQKYNNQKGAVVTCRGPAAMSGYVLLENENGVPYDVPNAYQLTPIVVADPTVAALVDTDPAELPEKLQLLSDDQLDDLAGKATSMDAMAAVQAELVRRADAALEKYPDNGDGLDIEPAPEAELEAMEAEADAADAARAAAAVEAEEARLAELKALAEETTGADVIPFAPHTADADTDDDLPPEPAGDVTTGTCPLCSTEGVALATSTLSDDDVLVLATHPGDGVPVCSGSGHTIEFATTLGGDPDSANERSDDSDQEADSAPAKAKRGEPTEAEVDEYNELDDDARVAALHHDVRRSRLALKIETGVDVINRAIQAESAAKNRGTIVKQLSSRVVKLGGVPWAAPVDPKVQEAHDAAAAHIEKTLGKPGEIDGARPGAQADDDDDTDEVDTTIEPFLDTDDDTYALGQGVRIERNNAGEVEARWDGYVSKLDEPGRPMVCTWTEDGTQRVARFSMRSGVKIGDGGAGSPVTYQVVGRLIDTDGKPLVIADVKPAGDELYRDEHYDAGYADGLVGSDNNPGARIGVARTRYHDGHNAGDEARQLANSDIEPGTEAATDAIDKLIDDLPRTPEEKTAAVQRMIDRAAAENRWRELAASWTEAVSLKAGWPPGMRMVSEALTEQGWQLADDGTWSPPEWARRPPAEPEATTAAPADGDTAAMQTALTSLAAALPAFKRAGIHIDVRLHT